MASRNASSITKSQYSQTKTSPSRTCLCSPTNHPGSFRCSMHKKPAPRAVVARPLPQSPPSSSVPHQSLKAILLQIIKPSSNDAHRKKNFQPKPSRFCLMNSNRGAVAVS
ncbi:hypothetical protein SESBI_44281 [Sesbania bispinosa]|nr:hypothetical protein SESBI_44281 [Sesbania bispinosa]